MRLPIRFQKSPPLAFQRRLKIVGYSAGGGLAGKLVQFLALTYLALIISPAEYGLFAILHVLVMGVSSIASSSLAFASNKAAANMVTLDPALRFLSVISVIVTARSKQFALLLGLNVTLIPSLYFLLSGGRFSWVLPIFGAFTVAIVFTDMLVGAMAGFGSYKKTGLFEGVRAAVSGGIVLSLGAIFGYIGAGFGLFAIDLIIAIWVACAVFRHRHDPKRIELRTANEGRLVSAGITSNTFAQMGGWLLVWVIQANFGLAAVAVYAIANRFATLVLLAPAYLSKNMLGEMNRLRAPGNHKEFVRLTHFYVMTVGAMSLAASVLAWIALPALFSNLTTLYEGLTSTLLVLLVATVLRAVATCLGVICVAQEQLKTWVLSDLIGLISLVVACLGSVYLETNLAGLVAGVAVSNLTILMFRLVSLIKQARAETRIVEHD